MPDAEIRSAGIGGNTTGQGLARMEADVLAGAPDVVVVLFGTNDSVLRAPKAYRTPLDQYKKNLEKIVLACREKGAEPILCTLPPIVAEPYYTRHPKAFYEPEGGLAAIVGRYRDAAVAVAKAHDVTLVDLNQQLIPEKHLKPDGVHPNKEGEAAIARLVAKAVEQVVAARVAAE
jgi:lysophospholipase L1-like esterase